MAHCSKVIEGVKVNFDSKFERDLYLTSLKDCEYHVKENNLNYVVPHFYEADFKYGKYLIECKAFFRVGDTQKYKYIAEAAKEAGKELVFVFYSHNKPLPGARRRKKCGTRRSHEDYCDKLGIRYFHMDTKDLLNRIREVGSEQDPELV